MQFALAFGGEDGFIHFWLFESSTSDFSIVPKARDIPSEKLFYTKKRIPYVCAREVRQRFEKVQQVAQMEEKTIVDELVDRIILLEGIRSKAETIVNEDFSKIHQGEPVSPGRVILLEKLKVVLTTGS